MSTAALEARIANVEGVFVQVGDRLNSIDRRLDSFEQRVDNRLDAVERRLDSFEQRVDARFAQADHRFMWLTGIVVGTWIATILAIIFRH